MKRPASCPDRQFHTLAVGQIKESFTIDIRYTNLKLIGKGSYGSVASAFDAKTGKNVAIKKIKSPFKDDTRGKRILREIKLLLHFSRHENIIGIHDMMAVPHNSTDFHEVYIVCSLMESDLDQIIGSSQTLSEQHHKYFLYQILRGLKHIHAANVVHRDLKPSNLLVNANCDLSLCDFGLSRGVDGDVDIGLTEYVVTRWYRAPELLCETSTYGKSVDIWSVGCIFGEMLRREPIFQGKNPLHQLSVIISILGCPPIDTLGFEVQKVTQKTINDARKRSPSGLKSILPVNTSCQALDLLSRMLIVNPECRITADDAMKHPYLEDIHKHMRRIDENNENYFVDIAEKQIFDNAFEAWMERGNDSPTYSHDLLKSLMHEEIVKLQQSVTRCI